MPNKAVKNKKPQALVVVSHPDDEALFFGGLMLTKKFNWHVICVTDGNADGLRNERRIQFRQSCKVLGVKTAECWNFSDIFEKRLDISKLESKLRLIEKVKKYDSVFTHGILGEYGHVHHQDVSYAVHSVFAKKARVYSVAYNTYPDLKVALSQKNYKIKTKVLWDIYSGETRRLLHFLPATSFEGFSRIPIKEISAIYSWLSTGTKLNKAAIKYHSWLIPYLKEGGGTLKQRVF